MNYSTIINMVKPMNISKSERSKRIYSKVYHSHKVLKNQANHHVLG